MSIIRAYQEGKTELNKLKFKPTMGAGHPGNPPLIQKRIPNENQNQGALVGTELGKRLDDTGRIAQLFARREGLGFLANNTILNSAVENSYKVSSNYNRNYKEYVQSTTLGLGKSLLDTLETLGTTLAQIPVSGTGVHFVKGKLFSRPNDQLERATPATKYLGDPGRVIVRTPDDKLSGVLKNVGQDSINMLRPFASGSREGSTDLSLLPDYVQFYFEVLNTDTGVPSDFMQFRSYLDNFEDSYTGNWNQFNYVGRAESFYSYQSFNRSVSVSFKSAAATKQELDPIYEKLNYLASTTAPSYSGQGIMKGTVVRMTIGNYIYDTPGFLTSVNYSWQNGYPWEIEGRQLPHVLNCSLAFTPIHTFTPVVKTSTFIGDYEQI